MTTQNNLPVEFSLTAEQRAEIERLATELHNKCYEFEAPFMVAICVGRSDAGSEVAEANYFDGKRTPDCMAMARHIVDKNIRNPIELMASLSQ